MSMILLLLQKSKARLRMKVCTKIIIQIRPGLPHYHHQDSATTVTCQSHHAITLYRNEYIDITLVIIRVFSCIIAF